MPAATFKVVGFLNVLKTLNAVLPELFDSFAQTVCDHNVKPIELEICTTRNYKVINLMVAQRCGCQQLWETEYYDGKPLVWKYYNRGGGNMPTCLPITHTMSATPDGEIHSSIPR